MKKLTRSLMLILSITVLFCLLCFSAAATEYTQGDYTYTVADKQATIIDYNGNTYDELVIPSKLGGYPVVTIGYKAFEYSNFTSVVIPDTVKTIGDSAFYDCGYLSEVVLGKNVKKIYDDAFRYCSVLSEIDFPDSLEYIGDDAFYWCDSLYDISIPESVSYIGWDAFCSTGYYSSSSNWTSTGALYLDGCLLKVSDNKYTGGATFTVKSGTRLIAVGVFGMRGVTINLGQETNTWQDITKIKIPKGIEHICCDFSDSHKVYYPDVKTLFRVGNADCGGIYVNNKLLTDLVIPSGITEVPDGMFRGYEKLKSVTFSTTVKSIGEYSFASTGLTSVTIPGNVKTIGSNAFDSCKSLKSVTLKNGVTTIEAYVFGECDNLSRITIPASLKKVGMDAFAYCFYLQKVYISDLKSWLNIDFDYENSSYYGFAPMSNPLCYDAYLYLNNKKVTQLVIPGGITKIKKGAFVGVDGITEVIIPEGVKEIGAGAFYFFNDYMEPCSFIIPKSVTSIGTMAFASTAEEIYYRGSSKQWKKIKLGDYSEVSSPTSYNYTADHIHKYSTTVVSKASFSENGKTKTTCSRCSAATTATVYKIKTVTLNNSGVVYNGSNQLPSLTIKDSKGNLLVEGTDYSTKTPSEMKNPGSYTVTVTFKGKYSGTKKLTFKITLESPKLKFKSATSESVSLKWAAVSGAGKYEIYRLSGDNWKKVASTANTSYTVKSLKAGTVYKFRIRAVYGSVFSSYSSVLTSETPTTAKKTTTVAEISKSTTAAMKYLKDNVSSAKTSNIIPGLNRTVTASSYNSCITTCTSMTPQGMTIADNYLLISAYCNCGNKHSSVIYVIDNKTQKYLTTLILDTTCHVGGIAKLGDYLWVCDSSKSDKDDEHILKAYKFSDVKSAVGNAYKKISAVKDCNVDTKPSFMCTANGYLYVGTFYKTSKTCTVYYYSVNGTTLTKKGSFKISGLAQIQGISIRGQYMVVTASYGSDNKSKAYVYKDSGKFKTNGKKYSSPVKKFKFPNMLEACYISSSQTYFLFESGAKEYRSDNRAMPLDKYVSITNSKLGIK